MPGISNDAFDPGQRADAKVSFELFYLVLGKVIGGALGYDPPQQRSPCQPMIGSRIAAGLAGNS